MQHTPHLSKSGTGSATLSPSLKLATSFYFTTGENRQYHGTGIPVVILSSDCKNQTESPEKKIGEIWSRLSKSIAAICVNVFGS